VSAGKIKIRVKRPWVGYPSSPVQQNYGESLTHGYLLWDIADKSNFDVKFCELPNPQPYVTLEWTGSIGALVNRAKKICASGGRFRIRSKDVLAQKEVTLLTQALQEELKASEVTFKNDHQVNRDVLQAGAAILAKEDLRNPDVLLKLVKDYHPDGVTDDEWSAVREQIGSYLTRALDSDDVVRNTKWSLRHLAFDNMFAYGAGNVINFDKLPGIVGIFGPNRAGKSSIVGTVMYSLFNTTDRGNVKNLHVVNVRHDHCYTKAIIDVNGTGYVIERQTVKHENKHGAVNANTNLNVFRINDTGEAVDLAGEERKDTEKVIRKLIGTGDDCLLTSVASQDEIKQYINHGSTKRRQILSRFLDLDIFDRMFRLATDDVNVNKAALRQLPERDWQEQQRSLNERLDAARTTIDEKDHLLHDASQQLDELRQQLASFKDFIPVTQTQVESQRNHVDSLTTKARATTQKIDELHADIGLMLKKVTSIDAVLVDYDLGALKQRQEAYRVLESSFEVLRHAHEKDADLLKQQQRSLKILDDVPCGDDYPTCRFIKDAHKNKERVEPQRDKVERSLDKLQKAELALQALQQEDLHNKVTKVEQLISAQAKLRVDIAAKQVQLVKLEGALDDINGTLEPTARRLAELEEALKNEGNVEVVTLRRQIDELQKAARRHDSEKLTAASEVGRMQSDLDKLAIDATHRHNLLQLMKAHELIAQAFSRKGIPALITTSQLPVINAEIAEILHGIVDFNIELEVDDVNDSMEVYIDYGDSRRPIELASGMEKMIASLAIRVALINVSSLPKTDMFIIDEAFGPMDPASVEACNRLLMSLKRYFKTIVVITHVDGVKDAADHIIEINKVEKDSCVMYNESWHGDRTSETD